MHYKPDFLIKPYEVYSHPNLRPTDSDIYAVVYWFERMKDGKCIASNETIAEVACLHHGTVANALNRLEKAGFIERVYEDTKRINRLEIKTMVHMTKTSESKTPAVPVVTEKKPTPGEIARDFFSSQGEVTRYRDQILQELIDQGIDQEILHKEARKFYIYWTEPNKSGTKQRWELQKTFDIKRRLYTWLDRAGQKTNQRAGAGRTV